MDEPAVNDSAMDAKVIEAAARDPLAMAVWLVADRVLSLVISVQEAMETRMRTEVSR